MTGRIRKIIAYFKRKNIIIQRCEKNARYELAVSCKLLSHQHNSNDERKVQIHF